jgi:hypothetical protein
MVVMTVGLAEMTVENLVDMMHILWAEMIVALMAEVLAELKAETINA